MSFIHLSAGYLHTCALGADRRAHCWGKNDRRQASPEPGEFVQISAGGYHTCGVRADGSLACWGDIGPP